MKIVTLNNSKQAKELFESLKTVFGDTLPPGASFQIKNKIEIHTKYPKDEEIDYLIKIYYFHNAMFLFIQAWIKRLK
jgi:hypothetical protein